MKSELRLNSRRGDDFIKNTGIKDMRGKRFGRLVVLNYANSTKHGAHWLCQCDCGNKTVVDGRELRRGHAKSCGCLLRDSHKVHGDCKRSGAERLYRIWQGMKNRCRNPSAYSYKWYGAKGVMVCGEWEQSYDNFKKWAVDNGYTDNLTIDRIDVNGDYEPSNCRWVSVAEQHHNTSRNIFIDYNGETHTLKEWSDISNINYQTLRSRYGKGERDERLFRGATLFQL